MKRNNGYLNLAFDSKYDQLVKNGIIKPLSRHKVCFYIESLGLFFKEEDNCYPELIGSEIAKFLNIDSVYYDILEFVTSDKTIKGVVSNDFREDNYKLITIDKIIDEYLIDSNKKVIYNDMNLELLCDALNNHYINYENRDAIVNKIMDNIKKSFLFDILIGNIDNGRYNYELKENDIDGKLTPYFDYEQIFKFGTTRLTVDDNNNYDVYDNLLNFLNSEVNYVDYFKKMYDLLTPDKIEELFIKIENDKGVKIPDNYKNIVFLSYSRHYNNIGIILEKVNSHSKR